MKHSEHDTSSIDLNSRHATVAVPRSRGAVTGLLLTLLGAWGALLPLIGPHFHFGYGPDNKYFDFTAARFWLQILPGVVVFVAGLLILLGGNRVTGTIFAYLAAAAGAWFVVGPVLADLRSRGYVGNPLGGNRDQHLGNIAAFSGLGAVILFLAALTAGRLSVVGIRDLRTAEKRHDHGDDTQVVEEKPVYTATREVPVSTTSIRPAPAPVTAARDLTVDRDVASPGATRDVEAG